MFVFIGAIPIVLLGASFWRREHYRELIRMVDHTREVQVSIQDLLNSLTDAETGRRGFVLTGDPDYLAAVKAAAAKSSGLVRHLEDLTQDNPVQERNAQKLEALVTERLRILERTSQFGGQDAADAGGETKRFGCIHPAQQSGGRNDGRRDPSARSAQAGDDASGL